MSENIKGYSIKRQLGVGGMSRVYLAYDPKLKRNLAIKVLLPSYSSDKRVTKRFIKEARTAAQLQHSNIISIFDVGKEDKYYFIAMEYLKESLKDRIKKGLYKNNPEGSLKIVKNVAKALMYAHKRRFIHRDIKPDNIMFRDDNTVVLVDFGIVKALGSESNLTRTGMSVGTPKYMSPEQIRAKRVDERSDIYSLGIVLYEMLTGSAPFKDNDIVTIVMKHASGHVLELPAKFSLIQPLLSKMVAKNPSERVRNCEGLIRLIDALLYKIKNNKTGSVKKYEQKSVKKKVQNKNLSNKSFVGIIFASILITSLLTASFFLIREAGIKREQTEWETTIFNSNTDSINNYLKKYPKGKHVKLAMAMLNKLLKKSQSFNKYLNMAKESYSRKEFKKALALTQEAEKFGKSKELDSIKKRISDKLNNIKQ